MHNISMVTEDDDEIEVPSKEKTLEEIYEEFWDLIDDNSEVFRDLIRKDERRKPKLF